MFFLQGPLAMGITWDYDSQLYLLSVGGIILFVPLLEKV